MGRPLEDESERKNAVAHWCVHAAVQCVCVCVYCVEHLALNKFLADLIQQHLVQTRNRRTAVSQNLASAGLISVSIRGTVG